MHFCHIITAITDLVTKLTERNQDFIFARTHFVKPSQNE